MKKLVLVLLYILGPIGFSQQDSQDRKLFSQVLFENLPDYTKKAQRAYRFNDYQKGKDLFEDFTNNKLEGSFMDNLSFSNLKKDKVNLYDFEKPVFLITYATWCIPAKGEIPALNELAKEYKDQIEFIVLFWDNRKAVKKMADKFEDGISVMYVDETENRGAYTVKLLKHSLGLPTCFLISENKKVMEIRRSIFPSLQTQQEEAFREHYIALETAISNNLVKRIEDVYAENTTLE